MNLLRLAPHQTQSRQRLRPLLFLTLILVTWPAAAAEDWHLRGGAAWFESDVESGQIPFDAEGELGVQLTVERRLTTWLGLELGAFYGTSTFTREASIPDGPHFVNEAEVSFPALTAALNIHGPADWPVDIYFGPLFTYLDFEDVSIMAEAREDGLTISTSEFERQASSRTAWGAQIGADFGLGENRWDLHVSVRYLDSSLETFFAGNLQEKLDFDLLFFGTGISYRF